MVINVFKYNNPYNSILLEIGMNLELEEKKNIGKIMTGSYDLNKWLEGGYEKDIITMF